VGTVSQHPEDVVPSLTYDTSNKLSIENLTPTSTTLTDPNGSSFDIGTASNVYIRDSGTYSIVSKDANTFVLASNTVTGTPTGTTYNKRVPLAFHHGTFANSGDPYNDGSVTVAAVNGHVFSDTPTGTYSWGTLGSASNTTTNSTYTWTPVNDIEGADVLMVAGGGGGGGFDAGGGGAGGLLFYEGETLSGQKTIVVGNGGIGGIGYSNGTNMDGSNGFNTSFTGLVTVIGGGGGGGNNFDADGKDGGSGGGSGKNKNGGGVVISGQGNIGGSSSYDTNGEGPGGGGGGAGSPGQDAQSLTLAGNGGSGMSFNSISSLYGDDGYFASGGGGGVRSGTPGVASKGGGSNGANNNIAQNAKKHTGGGGGGIGNIVTDYQTGGSGGSGIVLIMLPTTVTTPSQTYDTTKTITVSNVPSTQTGITGKIYKGSTAYTIHATTSSSNVIIENEGTYVSVFTTATQAFLTNAIDATQPTITSDDTTIEDEAPLVTTTTSVDTILAFHYGSFDTVYGDADVNAAAAAGRVFDNTPAGTYPWGTITLPSTASNQTTYTWTPPSEITGADVLMVAGGGGGGRRTGGGGGAGGLVFKPSESVNGQQTIVIGNGGTGATAQNSLGTQGKNTTFLGYTAFGGGAGSCDANRHKVF
jgi:hypothetical protein